jgi:hypothetical protein
MDLEFSLKHMVISAGGFGDLRLDNNVDIERFIFR